MRVSPGIATAPLTEAKTVTLNPFATAQKGSSQGLLPAAALFFACNGRNDRCGRQYEPVVAVLALQARFTTA